MGSERTDEQLEILAEAPTKGSKTSVTVIVPIHNEADYLPGAVPRLMNELKSVNAETNVVLIENGSTDGTPEIAEQLAKEHPGLSVRRLPDANYGAAIREGFQTASDEWVVSFDIDYFSGSFLASALEQLDRADIVIGSKRAPGSQDRRGLVRKAATWQLNTLLRLMLGLKVSDTHGMKAIRVDVLDDVLDDVVSTNDLFDTELVLRAERIGYRIVELPVIVEEERESKSRIWKRVPRTIRGIWKIRTSL